MATSIAADELSSPVAPSMDGYPDPFTSTTSPSAQLPRQRFSAFDSQLFSLGPNASPAQAQQALKAHLAETDRRMEQAGKLGTALVQQRKELTERLKDVEKLQAEEEVSEDLKQKLADIEKEYNEVAKESARAFLPKLRVPSNEAAAGSPYVLEGGRSGRRSVSPSKFEAQATGSPTKLGVPNRKLRNQPANRIHDIEFAAEISTSLIAQVRNLQGLLAEKEEELRDVKFEKSKLEYDAEVFQQRVKTLDESESRYKDENWSLETQVDDLSTAQRDSAEREKKLQQTVNLLQAEKATTQQKMDELKLNHAKLSEEHASAIKHHDVELGAAKRNMVMADSERSAMQRKIEDLTGQNQELAKAVSSQRGRLSDRQEILGMSDEDFETANDNNTPEHSPPPSPVKGTPRHSLLESETLKTSLHHAQRTIQSLRSNIHREKTEKLEMRRMLQDARDELEKIRGDPMANNKRARKTESREFKKPPRLLGNLRSARSEIFTEDPNWEDNPDSGSPSHSLSQRGSTNFDAVIESTEHEQFDTANETSDQAFETANERGTESEFHTGAEEFSSEDAQTETESPSKRHTLKGKPPALVLGLGRSGSVHSTASTEDEYDFDDLKTPTSQLPSLQAKFPLRVSRGAFRRSRQASEDPQFQSSPASFAQSSTGGTPQQPIQSLAAELGDFDGSDNESNLSATPSRRLMSRPGSIRGTTASPPPPVPSLPRVVMVDSGVMTDPAPELLQGRPMSMNTVSSQRSASDYSESGANDLGENLAQFPAPPTSPPKRDFALISQETHAAELETLRAEHAKQIEQLHAETAAAHETALVALKTGHTDQLSRSVDEVKSTHAQEVEALRSGHSDEIARSAAETKAAHAQELEAIAGAHAEKMNSVEMERNAAHASELEALRTRHEEQLLSVKKEKDDLHAAELAALVAAHAAQIEHARKELSDSHADDLKSLKASHDEQIEQTRLANDAAHAEELERLKTTHLAHLDETKNSIATTHHQELEALRAAHATQTEQSTKDSEAAHAAALAALVASHATQLETTRAASDATLAKELDGVKVSHAQAMETSKAEGDARLASELQTLRDSHAKQLESSHAEGASALSKEIEALKASHAQQLNLTKTEASSTLEKELESLKGAHAQELEKLKRESTAIHAAEIAALVALHAKHLSSSKSDGEATLSRELATLKSAHAQEIDSLRSEHATSSAKELEGFKAALDKQVESSKSEGNVAHSQQIEAINAAHAEIVDAHKRDAELAQTQALESLMATHGRQVETLRSEHAAAKSKEIEDLIAGHEKAVETLKQDHVSSKTDEINELVAKHESQLAAVQTEAAAAKARELDDLVLQHQQQIGELKSEAESTKLKELGLLAASHESQIEALKTESSATRSKEFDDLTASHLAHVEALKAESTAATTKELDELSARHTSDLELLRSDHQLAIAKLMEELAASHALKLEALRNETEATKAKQLEDLASTHTSHVESLKAEHDTVRTKDLEDLKSSHSVLLATLRSEHQSALDNAVTSLKDGHSREIESLSGDHNTSKAQALDALALEHSQQLETLKAESDAALARELSATKAEYDQTLDAHRAQSSAEREKLLASHALELEALRKSLAVTQPPLGFSTMSAVETHPEEDPGFVRSPKREAFIIPREPEQPQTPTSRSVGVFGKRDKDARAPIIAEDETRQSPSAAAGPETPESQRPFKEISTNTDMRTPRKQANPTIDQGAQTSLTSDGMDRLMRKNKRRASQDSFTITTSRGEVVITPFDDAASPSTVRRRGSSESMGSVARARARMNEMGIVAAPEAVPARRPGSSASSRAQNLPPLPPNHREVIEAARTESSGGGKGTMGPPLLPASAYKNSRPRTPRDVSQLSPTSGRGTPTPRGVRSNSSQGYADLHSPTRMRARSRQSSVSSFASEIETRFNIRGDMAMEAAGLAGPGTDPRMIQAITQTMIGEYLWKYTRKAGRGEMSENRHRRYFWVHPYTRTLYWSDRDPSAAGRAELKAKSVPIEAVRVVTDDNPMPPGLHRKSLVIISPGRTVKFTCTTGQRHETWFNALSYLLLRTGTEGQNDTEEIAGNITQEDVDEFNPSFNRRPTNGNRPRAPPSLSSYNSRTTRNESPTVDMSMSIPTLTPTHERGQSRPKTLSRLSGYWKSNNSTASGSGIFSSFRGRSQGHHIGSAIYEASEVHDSAEDLRQIIEQQDRESDRLENVRACCDGKHDVGTLTHGSKRNRPGHTHSHSHTHPGQSTATTPSSTLRSRA